MRLLEQVFNTKYHHGCTFLCCDAYKVSTSVAVCLKFYQHENISDIESH